MATDLGKISQTTEGVYDNTKIYERLDTVSFEGSSYLSRINNNDQPLSNLDAWQVSALKGSKGDPGLKGDSGYKTIDGVLVNPNDPTPSVVQFYKPTVSDSDGVPYPNLTPAVDVNGNITILTAKDGYDTLFFFDGTNWTKSEVKLPESQITVENEVIPTDQSKAISGKAVSSYIDESSPLFTDPYFRFLENINGSDKELNSISNSLRGSVSNELNFERNIILSDTTALTYVGLNFNLTDLNLKVGDTITVGINAKSDTSRTRTYILFYDADGVQIGYAIYSEGAPPQSIANYTLFKITTIVPTGAVRFQLRLERISGADFIYYTGLGIFKGRNLHSIKHDKSVIADPLVNYKSDKFFNTVERIINSTYSLGVINGISSVSKKFNLREGLQNFYFKKTGGATGTITFTPSAKFNKSLPSYILLPIYIPDVTNLTNIELAIRNEGSGSIEGWIRNATNSWLPSNILKKGWNLLRWRTDDSIFTNFGNQISQFRISLYSAADKQVEAYTPGVYFEYAPKCKMLMTLDHGRNSGWGENHLVVGQTQSGFKDAEDLGMILTMALNPKKIDAGDSVRLTLTELNELKERPYFRWNFHSYNATATSAMTLEELKNDTQNCVNWLQAKGFGKPQWRSVFTQNSAANGRNILGYLDLASLASNKGNSGSPLCGFPFQDRSNIGRYQIAGRTRSQLDDYFSRLKTFKGLSIPYTHGIYAEQSQDVTSVALSDWLYFKSKCQIGIDEGWLEFVGYEELKAELVKYSIEDNDESIIKRYFELF